MSPAIDDILNDPQEDTVSPALFDRASNQDDDPEEDESERLHDPSKGRRTETPYQGAGAETETPDGEGFRADHMSAPAEDPDRGKGG